MKTKFYKKIDEDIRKKFSLNFLIANGHLKNEKKILINQLSDEDKEKWNSYKQFSTLLKKFKYNE